jgi:hypothetical protein
MRSFGAVVAGAVLTVLLVSIGTVAAAAVLAGADGSATGGYLAANVLLSFGAAVAGGWLVARLAPRRPLVHAAVLAGFLVVASLPMIASPAAGQPAWYPPLMAVLGAAGVMSGARVWVRRSAPHAPEASHAW